jgi:hypothetical protein
MYFGGDVYWFCTVSDFLFTIFLIAKRFYNFTGTTFAGAACRR